ncbi:casein kinase 2 regulatory subunit [Microsporum audouinii]
MSLLSDGAGETWISSYCSLMGHEYFAEVSEEFIEDDFNLTGLGAQVPRYKEALELILDVEPDSDEEDEDEDEDDYEEDEDIILGDERSPGYKKSDRKHSRVASDLSVIESSGELLYGLIHQRYITSRQGMQQMFEKYQLQHFGSCPRVLCGGCKVLPVGRSDAPGVDTVKLYCPSCQDIYTPPNSRFQSVDGAFFGTTFGCLFFMTFPELDVASKAESAANALGANARRASHNSPSSSSTSQPPSNQPTQLNGFNVANLAPGLGPGKIYEPRIYGFKVSERARSGPRMKWLRMKPEDINELDETTMYHSSRADSAPSCDEDEEDQGDINAALNVINQRKKAPIRRRRVIALNSADPMGTNGDKAGK